MRFFISFTIFGVVYVSCLGDEDAFVYEPNSVHANQIKISSASVHKENGPIESEMDRNIDNDKYTSSAVNDDYLDMVNFDETDMFERMPGDGDGSKDIPILIWWTERLFMYNSLQELNCPPHPMASQGTCYTTKERKYMSDLRTRGLFFYGTDLLPEDLPLPRENWHEWALFHEESPMNNFMLSHGTFIKLFNYTSSFKEESDYPVTSQSIRDLNYLTRRKPLSIKTKNFLRKEKKIAPVLYVQSHCNVASDRDRYVKELMKFINIDSYGKCVNNRAIPAGLEDPVRSMDSADFFDFISQYKFHLAFENAVCKDYMTEKLFRPLHVGSVPIYRGSSAVRKWMPNNHSVILVDDYKSPKELADFLNFLDSNDEEYEHFLVYKTQGVSNKKLIKHINEREWGVNDYVKPDMIHGFECYFCLKILERYEREKLSKKNPDIALLPPRTASVNHLSCPQPYTSLGDPDDYSSKDSWKNQDWIDDYWSSFDKALAVKKMIEVRETDASRFDDYWNDIMKKQNSLRPHP